MKDIDHVNIQVELVCKISFEKVKNLLKVYCNPIYITSAFYQILEALCTFKLKIWGFLQQYDILFKIAF